LGELAATTLPHYGMTTGNPGAKGGKKVHEEGR